MNKSKQRDVVLEVLRSTKSHPTVEWVYHRAKTFMPSISLATVYRNMEQLKQAGEIIEVYGGFAKSRFDGNPARHVHLVCSRCNCVEDVEIDQKIDSLIMNQKIDSQIDDYMLTYVGVCSKCLAQKKVIDG